MIAAAAQLKALGAVPASDLAFLKKYGPSLQNPKVVADLKYLQANGPSVQKAAADSPKQWQHYFWVAVGGEIVFIPLIFLMAGYWSTAPRASRPRTSTSSWSRASWLKPRFLTPDSPVLQPLLTNFRARFRLDGAATQA